MLQPPRGHYKPQYPVLIVHECNPNTVGVGLGISSCNGFLGDPSVQPSMKNTVLRPMGVLGPAASTLPSSLLEMQKPRRTIGSVSLKHPQVMFMHSES